MHIEYREDALSYRPHHHNAYEMIFILHGQSRFTVRDQSFLAGPGDIVFFSNLEEHSTNIVQTPYHRYFVMLPPRETDQMIGNARLLSIFKQRSAAFPYVLRMSQRAQVLQNHFGQLLLESDSANPWHNERVCALLTLILTEVCRLHPQIFPGHTQPHQMPISDIQSHLDIHYADRFSLIDLAKQYHVSAGYLSQCFREQVGHSPMQYVMLNRLTAACEMLLTSGLSVNQISGQCGFSDVNNFIRRFSQHYGVTPNKMKKQRGHIAVDWKEKAHAGHDLGDLSDTVSR